MCGRPISGGYVGGPEMPPATRSTTALVANPVSALQDVLDEARPQQMPVAVGDLSVMLDSLVDKLSFRSLREDSATQKALRAQLLRETQRLGVLPQGKVDARQFVDKLVNYINTWML